MVTVKVSLLSDKSNSKNVKAQIYSVEIAQLMKFMNIQNIKYAQL